MSDFLAGLRAELLDAHAAHHRRGRVRRVARALVARPAPALAAATCAAAVVAALLALPLSRPPDRASVRVLDVIRVGADPTDAVAAGGSVWVTTRSGFVRVDARTRRVEDRQSLGGLPVTVAAGPAGVWARTAAGEGGTVARLGGGPVIEVGNGNALAVGATTVWAPDVELPPEGLRRIDAATGRDEGLVDRLGIYALAVAGDDLWAVANNGSVLRLDAETGRVRARWPGIAISAGTADPALVADERGAWVLRTGQGADSQAIRLEGDRVVRRVPVDGTVQPVLAATPDGLWIATDDPLRGRSALVRLEPRTGRVTAHVGLDRRSVTDLVAVGDDVWAVARDGTIVVVGS